LQVNLKEKLYIKFNENVYFILYKCFFKDFFQLSN